MSDRTAKKKLRLRRLAEALLILAALVVVVMVAVFTTRVTQGVTRAVPTPAHQVRLEILNGCGQSGIAGKTARMLSELKNEQVEIRVIATGDFDIRPVQKSFLVSRESDQEPAELLAEILGMDPSEVTYKPLEHNYRQVSATLVVGEDFDKLTAAQLTFKE